MRLFIAIQLPDFVREDLGRIQTALRPAISARWIPDSQMHLTLKFIGETSESDLPRIVDALKSIKIDSPVELRVHGIACFPPHGRIRIIAASLEDDDHRCAKFQSDIDAACHSVGIPLEGRDYKPHITLARVSGRSPSPSRTQIAKLTATIPSGESFQIESFILIESRLSKDGPKYVTIATFAL